MVRFVNKLCSSKSIMAHQWFQNGWNKCLNSSSTELVFFSMFCNTIYQLIKLKQTGDFGNRMQRQAFFTIILSSIGLFHWSKFLVQTGTNNLDQRRWKGKISVLGLPFLSGWIRAFGTMWNQNWKLDRYSLCSMSTWQNILWQIRQGSLQALHGMLDRESNIEELHPRVKQQV